jgi:hypothetical protein
MNNVVLILLLSSEPRFIRINEAKVSEWHYSSKAKGSTIRDFLAAKTCKSIVELFTSKKRGKSKNPPPFFSLPSPSISFLFLFLFIFFFILLFSFSRSEFFCPKHHAKHAYLYGPEGVPHS